MAEYINKDDILPYLNKNTYAYRLVKTFPISDVGPVKHGYWDDSLDGLTPYCSECGFTHKCLVRTPNYCPNCGAKMDRE